MITRKVRLALINLPIVFSSLLLEIYDQEFDNTKILVTSHIQVQAAWKDNSYSTIRKVSTIESSCLTSHFR